MSNENNVDVKGKEPVSNDGIAELKKDTRIFLSDEEFECFKKEIEFSFNEAANLVPEFDSEKTAISNEQANLLRPFIFKRFTPYYMSMKDLAYNISVCVDKNHLNLHEN